VNKWQQLASVLVDAIEAGTVSKNPKHEAAIRIGSGVLKATLDALLVRKGYRRPSRSRKVKAVG
jgi:hypothetical protein